MELEGEDKSKKTKIQANSRMKRGANIKGERSKITAVVELWSPTLIFIGSGCMDKQHVCLIER